jgi:hypothetical protein
LRSTLQRVRTRWSKFSAAPDRRRRHQRARQWPAAANVELTGRAHSQEELDREGFSLCGLDEATKSRVLGAWAALKSEGPAADSRLKTTGKIFFEEMLGEAQLARHNAFIDVALTEGVLRAVMASMDMVPHLESIDILASMPTGDHLSASQLWHYDVNDERILKLFIYLEDVGASNGPFTFIPADSSRAVASAVGHYVTDEHIGGYVPRSRWRSVEGPAGTAFFIDTGRCYHFGSRCTQPRYVYIATYSSGLKFMRRARMWGDLLGARARELSPLQVAVCGLDR